MQHMKKASIHDLRTKTSELVRDAENGEVILIERGEPVPELRPVSKRRGPVKLPDMRRFWNEFPKLSGDSTDDIGDDRER